MTNTTIKLPALAAAAVLTLLVATIMAIQVRNGGMDLIVILFDSVLALLVVACWVAAIPVSPRSRHVWGAAMKHGAIVGGIAFALGFLVPVLVSPEANQGPLLGIFITGPIGFIMGVIVGAVRGTANVRADEQRVVG